MSRFATLTLAAALLALSGCATLSAPAPTDPNDPNQLAVLSAGDLGAVGCAILAGELSPTELAQAQGATIAALTVLADPVPSVSDLAAAFALAGLEPRYAALTGVVVQRVKVRLGGADLIPTDSVAWAMAASFVSSCASSLAAAPVA